MLPVLSVCPQRVYNLPLFEQFLLIDTRSASDYAAGHIVTALSCPDPDPNVSARASRIQVAVDSSASTTSSSSSISSATSSLGGEGPQAVQSEAARQAQLQRFFFKMITDGTNPERLSPIVLYGHDDSKSAEYISWFIATLTRLKQQQMSVLALGQQRPHSSHISSAASSASSAFHTRLDKDNADHDGSGQRSSHIARDYSVSAENQEYDPTVMDSIAEVGAAGGGSSIFSEALSTSDASAALKIDDSIDLDVDCATASTESHGHTRNHHDQFLTIFNRFLVHTTEVWILDRGYEAFVAVYPWLCGPNIASADMIPLPHHVLLTPTLSLFLGSRAVEPTVLQLIGITHVIIAASNSKIDVHNLYGTEILECNVSDTQHQNMIDCWTATNAFIDAALAQAQTQPTTETAPDSSSSSSSSVPSSSPSSSSSGRAVGSPIRVLIQLHGRSRSASIVIAWLLYQSRQKAGGLVAAMHNVTQCLHLVLSHCPLIDTNLVYLDQLARFEQQLRGQLLTR